MYAEVELEKLMAGPRHSQFKVQLAPFLPSYVSSGTLAYCSGHDYWSRSWPEEQPSKRNAPPDAGRRAARAADSAH